MKICRYLVPGGPASWGRLVAGEQEVEVIDGPLAEWGPRAARGESPAGRVVLSRDQVRLIAPLEPRARIFGVGANYRVHVEAFGAAVPDEPVAFIKPESAIVGPDEPIAKPAVTERLDFEIELVAVLARSVEPGEDPLAAVLGFTIGNDISARDAPPVFGGPNLYAMKALDATTPLGPWLVTRDEVGGEPALDMALRVNGEVRQQDNTSNMLVGIRRILDYLNRRTALRAGDVVFTGTTAGVGHEDGRYLDAGDVVEAEIERIGTLRNVVTPRR
jgi:2-keto-4-pentenoate hydratase/2-oxohepta-3-ene-1,7-dioic acid hydratase in catechol pathway